MKIFDECSRKVSNVLERGVVGKGGKFKKTRNVYSLKFLNLWKKYISRKITKAISERCISFEIISFFFFFFFLRMKHNRVIISTNLSNVPKEIYPSSIVRPADFHPSCTKYNTRLLFIVSIDFPTINLTFFFFFSRLFSLMQRI